MTYIFTQLGKVAGAWIWP